MPSITGIAHVELSVRDLDASEAWYAAVLGWRRIHDGRDDERGLADRVLFDPKSGVVLAFTQHKANPGEPFLASRTGLDHLAFAVADRDELRAWERRLVELKVDHTAVEKRPGGAALTAHDSDGIAIEFYVRDSAEL